MRVSDELDVTVLCGPPTILADRLGAYWFTHDGRQETTQWPNGEEDVPSRRESLKMEGNAQIVLIPLTGWGTKQRQRLVYHTILYRFSRGLPGRDVDLFPCGDKF